MSASLVGSEMCIRDRAPKPKPPELRPRSATPPLPAPPAKPPPQLPQPVSYTHLTLPTICSV
eukprot:1106327-Alexandrium_andersonii.AAC.1